MVGALAHDVGVAPGFPGEGVAVPAVEREPTPHFFVDPGAFVVDVDAACAIGLVVDGLCVFGDTPPEGVILVCHAQAVVAVAGQAVEGILSTPTESGGLAVSSLRQPPSM